MAGLTVQNFLSAATGMALAIALTRALARSKISTLGNFWVDMTRATLYVLPADGRARRELVGTCGRAGLSSAPWPSC